MKKIVKGTRDIVFDYGGVISNGSRKTKIINKLKHTNNSLEADLYNFFSSEFIKDAARGIYSEDDVYKEISCIINEKDLSSIKHVFEYSCIPNDNIAKLIKKLSVANNLYLISDSIPPFTNYIEKIMGSFFCEMFFSDRLNSRKSEKLFDEIESINPGFFNRCIYIDDVNEHLNVPKSKGAVVIEFKDVKQLTTELVKLGVLGV